MFSPQTLPICVEEDRATDGPGNVAGFSLQASVAVQASQRENFEWLCRYICRPPVSEKRLFLTSRGEIGYTLKTHTVTGRRMWSSSNWILSPGWPKGIYGAERSRCAHDVGARAE